MDNRQMCPTCGRKLNRPVVGELRCTVAENNQHNDDEGYVSQEVVGGINIYVDQIATD